MPGATTISVEHISKRFRLYNERYMTLKERVIHFGNLPFEEYWALNDVNIEIYEGETVGLLGHTVDITTGTSATTATPASGTVKAVTFSNGQPELTVQTSGGQTIANVPISEITQVM